MRGTRGAIASGVLLAAAVLTKQTGLAEGVAVIAALLAGPRRRLAWVAALAEVTVLGISTLLLALTSGGWYIFYVFRLMSEHPLNYGNLGWFWTALLTTLGMAACAAVIGARRAPPVLLAGCAALAVEGYAALVHSGGGSNDLLPAYLAVALLASLALGAKSSGWANAASGVLVLGQTALLLGGFHLSHAIPTSADRNVGERLTAGLRAFGGTVAVPADPGLSLLAGMSSAAHQGAAHDVLRASDQAAIVTFRASVAGAVAARQFSAIITDGPGPPPGYPPSLSRYYRQCPQPLLAGIPAAVFRPVAGISARPASLWLPRGGVSCQTAVSVVEGGSEDSHQ